MHHELGIVKGIAATGITATRTNLEATTWDIWAEFCGQLHVDPHLTNIKDTIPLLQVFAN
jgi:hypothetical protein